jgi:hypothetical protein
VNNEFERRGCLRWMQKMRHDKKTSQDIRLWGGDLKPHEATVPTSKSRFSLRRSGAIAIANASMCVETNAQSTKNSL